MQKKNTISKLYIGLFIKNYLAKCQHLLYNILCMNIFNRKGVSANTMQKKHTKKTFPVQSLILYILALAFAGLGIFMYNQIFSFDFGIRFMVCACIGCVIYGTLYLFAAKNKTVKLICRIIFIAILVFLLSFVIITSIIAVNGQTETMDEPNAPDSGITDYAVVFGARVYGERPSLSLQSRMKAAGEYLQENMSIYAILSGGMGEGETITEAQAMKKYMSREYTILTSHFLMEEESTDTEENIANSKKIMDERGGEYTVTAVSNGFHLYRIKTLFAREGIEDVYCIAAPCPNVSMAISMYIREYFAVIAMWLGI